MLFVLLWYLVVAYCLVVVWVGLYWLLLVGCCGCLVCCFCVFDCSLLVSYFCFILCFWVCLLRYVLGVDSCCCLRLCCGCWFCCIGVFVVSCCWVMWLVLIGLFMIACFAVFIWSLGLTCCLCLFRYELLLVVWLRLVGVFCIASVFGLLCWLPNGCLGVCLCLLMLC